MANLLSTGATWLAGVLNASAGTEVTLRREGKTPSTVTATKCRHQTVDDQQFGDLTSKEQDWIFTTDDYAFDGSTSRPNRGDTIEESGVGTFEVMGDQQGVHWDWHDAYETMIRVRTNLIERA